MLTRPDSGTEPGLSSALAIELNHAIVNVRDVANRHFGGRGVYFEEPGGHFLEVITGPCE